MPGLLSMKKRAVTLDIDADTMFEAIVIDTWKKHRPKTEISEQGCTMRA